MIWLITGQGQEAGGGARLVGAVARHSKRLKPRAGQPEPLPLGPQLASLPYPSLQSPRNQGFQSNFPQYPSGDGVPEDHSNTVVGTCCLPVARFQESFMDPASLCTWCVGAPLRRMLTQEVHCCWGMCTCGLRVTLLYSRGSGGPGAAIIIPLLMRPLCVLPIHSWPGEPALSPGSQVLVLPVSCRCIGQAERSPQGSVSGWYITLPGPLVKKGPLVAAVPGMLEATHTWTWYKPALKNVFIASELPGLAMDSTQT